MKKRIIFIVVLVVSLPLVIMAQSRFSVGGVIGMGNRMFNNSSVNQHQYNWALGLDGDVHIWRQLYGVGRVEFNQKSHTYLLVTSRIQEDFQMVRQDAMRYFFGLGWKTKTFYTHAGLFYNDFLGGTEAIVPLYTCCIGDCPLMPNNTREKFNAWGYYGAAGVQRPLTLRTKVLFELNYTREMGYLYSLQVERFQAVGFRMGMKYRI